MPLEMKPAAHAAMTCLLVCFFAGCASQARFSGSFSKRLTETQQEWHFYRRTSFDAHAQPPAVSGSSSSVDPFQLQKMLERLVYVSPLRGYPVRAALIPDSKVNAFTDGTTIFVTTGLLEAFRNREDLVASVLAHEMGHILGHHTADQASRTSLLDYMSYLTPAFMVLPYGGLYGSAAGAAMREGAKVRRFSYSRLQENEADAIGVFLAMRAGYDPHGLGDFLEVMPDASGFGPPQTVSIPLSVGALPESAAVMLLSTSPLYRIHPPSKKRRRMLDAMIRRQRGEISEETFRDEFRGLSDLDKTLKQRSPR